MEYGFIFDMDGVVIDSNPYHKTAWENFLRNKDIPFDDQFFFNVLSGRTGPTSMKIIFGDDLSEANLSEYLEEVWAAVSREALNMIFEGADASGFEEDARLTVMGPCFPIANES